MIKIITKMIIAEDKIEEFWELGKDMVSKSLTEPGNLSYSLNQNTNEPQVFLFIETWVDQAAVDATFEGENFTGIFPKLSAMCIAPADIQFFSEVM